MPTVGLTRYSDFLQGERVTKFLTIPLAAVLIVGVMLAQWLDGFGRERLPVTPVASAHDCSQHQCGCPAELSARHACCCFTHETPVDSAVTQFVRASQCQPNGSPVSASATTLDWNIVPVTSDLPVTLHTGEVPDCQWMCVVRLTAPPVPPPEFLPAA